MGNGGPSCCEGSWWWGGGRTRECGQLSVSPKLMCPLSWVGVEEQRITDEFLLGTRKLSSSEQTLWICLLRFESRICPSPDPWTATRVLWRTDILLVSDFSASSSSSFLPEWFVSLSRPSRFLQSGLRMKIGDVLKISKDFLMRVDDLLNSRLDLLRLRRLLKICLMFELSTGSILWWSRMIILRPFPTSSKPACLIVLKTFL